MRSQHDAVEPSVAAAMQLLWTDELVWGSRKALLCCPVPRYSRQPSSSQPTGNVVDGPAQLARLVHQRLRDVEQHAEGGIWHLWAGEERRATGMGHG